MIGSRATSGSVAITFRKVRIASLALEQVGVHVHVEHVRAAAHLLERDLDGAGEVAALDEPAEARRAGHVRPLADQHEPGVGADLERLEPAPARARRRVAARCRGAQAVDRRGDRGACARASSRSSCRRRSGSPACGELAQQRARHLRRLVVAAERVRQPGVRVDADEARRDPGELGDVRAASRARRASS